MSKLGEVLKWADGIKEDIFNDKEVDQDHAIIAFVVLATHGNIAEFKEELEESNMTVKDAWQEAINRGEL